MGGRDSVCKISTSGIALIQLTAELSWSVMWNSVYQAWSLHARLHFHLIFFIVFIISPCSLTWSNKTLDPLIKSPPGLAMHITFSKKELSYLNIMD